MLFLYDEDLVKIIGSIPRKEVTVYNTVTGVCKARLCEPGVSLYNETDTIFVDKHGRKTSDGECLVFPKKGVHDWLNWRKHLTEPGDVIKEKHSKKLYVVTNRRFDDFNVVDSEGNPGTTAQYFEFANEEEANGFFAKLEENGYKWNRKTLKVENFWGGIKPNTWYTCTKGCEDKGFTYGKPYRSDENGCSLENDNGSWCVWTNAGHPQEYFKKWTLSDAKAGDVLVSEKTGNPFIYKGEASAIGNPHAFGGLRTKEGTTEKEFYICDPGVVFEECSTTVRPATTGEAQWLFYYAHCKLFLWNKASLKFCKVDTGDFILYKGNRFKISTITPVQMTGGGFCVTPVDDSETDVRFIPFGGDVLPAMFDPTTFKPYDKIIVCDYSPRMWFLTLFSHYNQETRVSFAIDGKGYRMCVPYNEHTQDLVGTSKRYDGKYNHWDC